MPTSPERACAAVFACAFNLGSAVCCPATGVDSTSALGLPDSVASCSPCSGLAAGLNSANAEIVGPAPLYRLRGRYRAQLVAKTARPRELASRAGQLLSAAAPAMRKADLAVVVDVDPQDV